MIVSSLIFECRGKMSLMCLKLVYLQWVYTETSSEQWCHPSNRKSTNDFSHWFSFHQSVVAASWSPSPYSSLDREYQDFELQLPFRVCKRETKSVLHPTSSLFVPCCRSTLDEQPPKCWRIRPLHAPLSFGKCAACISHVPCSRLECWPWKSERPDRCFPRHDTTQQAMPRYASSLISVAKPVYETTLKSLFLC